MYNNISISQAGDELVRINGLTLANATHEEVVSLIKLKRTLTLTLKGLLPVIKFPVFVVIGIWGIMSVIRNS